MEVKIDKIEKLANDKKGGNLDFCKKSLFQVRCECSHISIAQHRCAKHDGNEVS